MEYLFTYGTLLSEFKHEALNRVSEYLTLISLATANGELYDLGNYPGFVEGDGEVKGELYSIANTEKVFEALDEYEGLHDAEPEYVRKKTAVTLPDGEKAESWIYVFQPKAGHRFEKINNGDYIAHVRNKVNNEGNY